MLENYFFDFDRTLADSTKVNIYAAQTAFHDSKLKVPSVDEIISYMGVPADKSFPQMADRELSEGDAKRLIRRFRNLYLENEDRGTVLYPGVEHALTTLKEQGKKLFVASAKETESLDRNLQKLGILDLFDETIGFDKVEHPKPNPEALLLLLDKYNLAAEDSVMIGDAKYDLIMGATAQMKTCGVLWGAADVDSLRAQKPTYLLKTPRELLEIS